MLRKFLPALHASEEYLELPQLGPGREWQSKLNNVMAAGIDAQTAAQRLTGHWSEVLHNTQRDFIASLSNEVGPAIETLAELNAQWTLAVEAQWRKRLLKEDYSRDFGEFVNAQARLKTALNDLFAELAQSFSQNGNEDIARLKASVDELRAELSDLADQRADKAGAVPPAPAVAKPQPAKTARRRRARKKTAANNSSAVKKPAERKKPSASRASSFDIDEL
ncbi:MAG: poly(R)-hydroxyalkanoic acid synthase subunit PhaE [Pseudomonadota bacterium]